MPPRRGAAHDVLVALLLASWLPAGVVKADDAAPATAGYTTTLFDGHSTAGWHVTDCEVAVEDGSLVLKSGNGLVRSDHRYRDFVLELDARPRKTEKWDSGFYFRADLPPEGKPWPSRYQVNLQQGAEGNVKNLPGAVAGGLTRQGEWNHYQLTVVGDTAALAINGQPAWKVGGVKAKSGYVGLQAEVPLGGEFEFKNIKITELGYVSLFDGRDLDPGAETGWEGADQDAARCWRVVDGTIMCTGQPGPWLRSKAQYGDFNLRLRYRLKPGGNSGVYVRVPRGGAHRGRELNDGRPSGVEVQLLDDADRRYASIEPYQFSASIYAVAPASPHVSRPAGEWNTIEINCRGSAYRITHNGVMVVDADEKSLPELATREPRGYLGLQNHSTEVWFRDLRLGPAE